MKNKIGIILFLFLWQHANAQSWQNVDAGVIWGNNDLAVLGVDVMTTDTIYNYLGQLNYFTTLNSVTNGTNFYISTNDLPDGIYMGRIEVNGQPLMEQKLIVLKE